MRFSNAYPVIFRSSGGTLATVALPLTLAAPDDGSANPDVGAVRRKLGLNTVDNHFGPTRPDH